MLTRTWAVRVFDGIRSGDEADIARAIEDLSRSRRYLAPLAYAVGGVAMLLGGVRLLFSNWRLTLIQLLPAVWIWLAMYDLRAHLLAPRAGETWFAVSLGTVVGLMMVAYIAVPSRLIGVEPMASRRDRLAATAVGGLLGAVLAGPPYVLGRIGLLMIGSPILRLPGFVVFFVAATLQAGATSAVRAVKMGARLGGTGLRRP